MTMTRSAALLALTFALLCFTLTQGAPITAKFVLSGSIQNGGRMNGRLNYDWASSSYSLVYDNSNGFKEQFVFQEVTKGFDGNFTGQYVYETAATQICGKCQRTVLNAEMPRFDDSMRSGGTWGSPRAVRIDGRDCQEYTYTGPNTGPHQAKKIAIAGSDQPCRLEFNSGKTLTFETATAPTATIDFSVPEGCRCAKRIDVLVLMDGSGSISNEEWAQQNSFVRRLLNEFTWGPDGASLTIVEYWGQAKLIMPTLDDLVKLQAFMASDLPRFATGTNVVAGMEVMKAEVIPNRRSNAIPLLLTITDGADRSSVAALQGNISILQGAPYNINNFVSVFVGNNAGTQAQMLALAGGNPTRTLVYSDYEVFAKAAAEIQSVACASDTPTGNGGGCGTGCCGMCMCGTCVTPDLCNDGLLCTTEELKDTTTAGLKCCTAPAPKDCPVPDACTNSVCNAADGACVNSAVVCTPHPNTTCFRTQCNPQVGCQSTDLCNTTNCDDGNACTTDVFDINNPNFCTHDLAPCVPKDACHTAKCDPATGCVQTPINVTVACDDFNLCTDDSCDPAQGCVNIARPPCDDSSNCTDDSCDPLQGCVSNLKSCPSDPEKKCEIGVCKDGLCSYTRPPLCEDEIIAVSLSTAAIVGIVIAVAVAAALGAFGIFKGVQAYNANKDLDDVGNTNPLYEQGGRYGESGIYVAAK